MINQQESDGHTSRIVNYPGVRVNRFFPREDENMADALYSLAVLRTLGQPQWYYAVQLRCQWELLVQYFTVAVHRVQL